MSLYKLFHNKLCSKGRFISYLKFFFNQSFSLTQSFFFHEVLPKFKVFYSKSRRFSPLIDLKLSNNWLISFVSYSLDLYIKKSFSLHVRNCTFIELNFSFKKKPDQINIFNTLWITNWSPVLQWGMAVSYNTYFIFLLYFI